MGLSIQTRVLHFSTFPSPLDKLHRFFRSTETELTCCSPSLLRSINSFVIGLCESRRCQCQSELRSKLLGKANSVDKIFETWIGVEFLQICVYDKERHANIFSVSPLQPK